MQIECKCGKEYQSKEAPCPDNRVGCLVSHFDKSSFICEDCGFDMGPAIAEAIQAGRVRQEIGMGVVNLNAIKKPELC